MKNIDLSKIKLVIFDLDNTLWSGLLSEDKLSLFDYTNEIFNNLLDLGIVISICSKNDYEDAKRMLKEIGLWDFIVMPSISWDRKGPRISELLQLLGLRAENTLFIDDQIENLKEAEYCNPKIQTLLANENSMSWFLNTIKKEEKKDVMHLKLKQYKELEAREKSRASFKNNTDFLYDSKIELAIIKNDFSKIERIHEMILKTNQLNFTKNRCSFDELKEDLSNSSNWGTIYVRDKYSFYGLVGFYLIKNNCLKHFLFSCRTIGIGAEQYVYEKLGFPNLKVCEPVSVNLKTKIGLAPWIKLRKKIKEPKEGKKHKNKTNMLFKGPCDLSVITGYISNNNSNIDIEFTFQDSENRSLEHQNSLINIVGSKVLSDKEKACIIEKCPFGHKQLYDTYIFEKKYDVIVLSLLTDFTIPVYKAKDNDVFYSCGQFGYSLVDDYCGPLYSSGKVYNGGFKITDDQLSFFRKHYDYLGFNNKRLYDSILFIRNNINPNCLLILTTGSEIKYENETNDVYKDRHLFHKSFNDYFKNHPIANTFLVDPNPIIRELGQQSFTNNINHYNKQVYLYIAEKINEIIKSRNLESFKIHQRRTRIVAFLKRKIFEQRSNRKHR